MAVEWRHEGGRLEQEMRTSASPAQVWAAWTTPQGLSSWFVDRAAGDAVEGGSLSWTWEGFGTHEHEVLAADPERRLVLRPLLQGGTAQLIEIRIEREGGETVLRLVHSGFGDADIPDELREGVSSGWLLALASLRESLERYPGAPRAGFLLMAPVGSRIGYDEIARWHRQPERLAAWLTDDGSLGGTGERAELRLKDGTRLSGPVLARGAWETAVRWEEERGVLELKAFRAPTGARVAALRFSAWGRDRAGLTQVEARLRRALDRLVEAVTP